MQIDWRNDIERIESQVEVEKVSPYMQGHLLLQNRDYHAVPYSMGIEPGEKVGQPFLPVQYPLNKALHDNLCFVEEGDPACRGILSPPQLATRFSQCRSSSQFAFAKELHEHALEHL